jgi:RNA polymerase sigma factor (sigma-70 family)
VQWSLSDRISGVSATGRVTAPPYCHCTPENFLCDFRAGGHYWEKMNAPDDAALLRRFVHQADETAFRTLVERHLPLVHASATRQLGGDTHLAEDVAQKVFALLAARAKRLLDHPTLAGWLFTTTRNLAHATQRARARRVFHENRSAMSNEQTPPRENEPSWAEFTPVLDQALANLGDRDREGVLLRFFENRSYAEIGADFGLSENAARMRVERSLEKLRRLLMRRGVAATAATLAGSLAAHGAPALAADFSTRVAAHALTTTVSAGALGGSVSAVIDFMSKAKIGPGKVACG